MYKLLSLILVCGLIIAPHAIALNTDGLVGAWLFDDGNGNTVSDSSGNGLDGKIVKGTPKWVDGKFGGAMEFGGADMVTVNDNDLLDLATFTISGWIKSPATSGKWHIIASKELRNPTGRNYGIFGHINNGTVHYSFTSNNGWKSFDASTNVTDDKWHHVTATYAKPNFKLYVDGKLDAESSPNADPDTHNNPLYIGGCDIGNYWMKGSIDEIVLFSRALDNGEINELMDKGVTDALDVKPCGKLVTTWSQIKFNATR